MQCALAKLLSKWQDWCCLPPSSACGPHAACMEAHKRDALQSMRMHWAESACGALQSVECFRHRAALSHLAIAALRKGS